MRYFFQDHPIIRPGKFVGINDDEPHDVDSPKFFNVMPLSPLFKRGNHKSPPFAITPFGILRIPHVVIYVMPFADLPQYIVMIVKWHNRKRGI
jgi:hypothetical protein